jgi:hypothetical protein
MRPTSKTLFRGGIPALVICMLLGSAHSAQAGLFDNASDLARACKTVPDILDLQPEGPPVGPFVAAEAIGCLGYINGFWHGYSARTTEAKSPAAICWPKGVTPRQIAAVFIRWMEANPQNWHLGPYQTMYLALTTAFPCSK